MNKHNIQFSFHSKYGMSFNKDALNNAILNDGLFFDYSLIELFNKLSDRIKLIESNYLNRPSKNYETVKKYGIICYFELKQDNSYKVSLILLGNEVLTINNNRKKFLDICNSFGLPRRFYLSLESTKNVSMVLAAQKCPVTGVSLSPIRYPLVTVSNRLQTMLDVLENRTDEAYAADFDPTVKVNDY